MVTIDVSGTKGTQRRTQLAIWDSAGTSQLACDRYTSTNADDVDVGAIGLTPGDWYAISVDAFNASYDGTFTICLDSTVDYDYYAGADDVTSMIGTCSGDAAYTTIGASSDQSAGSCWNNSGPQLNRWFRFQCPDNGIINITVDINGTKGTQRRTQVALWDSSLSTEVECARYTSTNADDVVLGAVGLTANNWYFISVDAFNTSYDGTFTLCLDSVADYDYYEGAEDVTGLIGTCSSDAAYTTIGASPDRSAGSCWNNSGPQLNRWFRFQCPDNGIINITVDINGTKGTQRRTQVALWDSSLSTEVECARYTSTNADDVVLGAVGLTANNWYFISVDAFNTSYDGTFTLCLDSIADYDYYEGAENVTSLIGTCSSDAAYTTIGASADRSAGSCWNNSGPQLNRWFRFQAPDNGIINITVDIDGTKGTQRRTQVALWDSSLSTEVECARYTSTNADDVVLGAVGLTANDWYFISVDAFNTSYDGTFTLCLDSIADYDYYEGAISLDGIKGGCSPDAFYTTIGASPDRSAGSCWNNSGPQLNRWFKFTSPNSGQINITIHVDGTQGTQRRTQIALWDSSLSTEIECARYTSTNADDVTIGSTSLTAGDTYFVSVDAFNTSYDGTFTICVDTTPDYDFHEGAVHITDVNNWCSSDAEYTTIGASPDKSAGSCWNNSGPQLNRWFKFQATALGNITITVDVSGTKGTQRRTQVALWDSAGTTEIECARYTSTNADDVVIGATGLTPNDWYFISVDAFNTSYDGTFTLCVDDTPDYDFYEGAEELTDLNNWCSADAAYTTIGASNDQSAGSCWNNSGPQLNRWFKFQAIDSDATITVDIDGTKGTQRRTQLAVWDSSLSTQIACARYVSNNSDVSVSPTGLTIGDWYFIAVDAFNTSYDGTFTLCIDNVQDSSYYSRADGDWNNPNTWSKVSHSGGAASDFPGSGDVVLIQGHEVRVDSTAGAADLTITVADDSTALRIEGAALTVNGEVDMLNGGNNFGGTIEIVNGGSLDVQDDMTLTRDGGANAFSLSLSQASTLVAGIDLVLDANGGSSNQNLITLANSSSISIGQDLNLDYGGGTKILMTLNDTSSLSVARDIYLTATGDDLVEIEMNDSTALHLGRDFERGSPAYGILDCNGDATMYYDGNTYLQNMADTLGSGTGDAFSYRNVYINNSRITQPNITLEGQARVTGVLTLNDGIVQSTSSNILTVAVGGSILGGSAASYVDGPLTIGINTASSTTMNFYTGNSDDYRRVDLTVDQSSATATAYTVEVMSATAQSLGYTLPGTVDLVSKQRYYNITQSPSTGLDDATVRLYYGVDDGVTDVSNLTVVKDNGSSAWVDLGGTPSGSPTGDILSGSFTSFSAFALGNLNGGTNPLPVELVDFDVSRDDEEVLVSWKTASEQGNDYFIVERSADGKYFEEAGRRFAIGNSNELTTYSWRDKHPIEGISYYRLVQVDLDGRTKTFGVRSVEMPFASKMKLYPNPNDGRGFTLSFETSAEMAKVRVYNSLGAIIYNSIIPNTTHMLRVDLDRQLPSGIYTVVYQNGASMEERRLVVE